MYVAFSFPQAVIIHGSKVGIGSNPEQEKKPPFPST